MMSMRALRLAARITGSTVLLFLLFMLVGHLVGDANGPEGMTFSSKRDIISFLMFPVCTMIGLAIAFKWELTGGAIAMLSVFALMIPRPDLLNSWFMVWCLPGLLYVVLGSWTKMHSRSDAR